MLVKVWEQAGIIFFEQEEKKDKRNHIELMQ